jgi:hypothetical protein
MQVMDQTLIRRTSICFKNYNVFQKTGAAACAWVKVLTGTVKYPYTIHKNQDKVMGKAITLNGRLKDFFLRFNEPLLEQLAVEEVGPWQVSGPVLMFNSGFGFEPEDSDEESGEI